MLQADDLREFGFLTLAEGEVSGFYIGLKGTMGALKDLADKTRRGIEGRLRRAVGRSPILRLQSCPRLRCRW